MVLAPLEALDLGELRIDVLDGGSLAFSIERPGKRIALELAVRPLLVRTSEWSCLIDPGFGPADPRRRERFQLRDPVPLEEQLDRLGVAQPDHVLLTHLHFDHAAGVLAGSAHGMRDDGDVEEARFPGAEHHVHPLEWDAAMREQRGGDLAARIERALSRLPKSLPSDGTVLGTPGHAPRIDVELASGHTEGLVAVWMHGTEGTAMFAADLVPTRKFLGARLDRMADQAPELARDSRIALLRRCEREHAFVLFYHDRDVAFARIEADATLRDTWHVQRDADFR
ncbi:MAG: MBL fold metallo-hydrolase [Planctomycetes bacterium]|nr:MBL fold metallo-hydrolase [Planctomycetota bacterium]